MDSLFPELPEDLSGLTDEELDGLLERYEAAAELIDANDEDFLKGMSGQDVIDAYKAGLAGIETIVAEMNARQAAEDAYQGELESLRGKRLEVTGKAEEEPAPDEGGGEEEETEGVVAEAEEITAEAATEETTAEQTPEVENAEVERELVTASVEKETLPAVRRVPKATAERRVHEGPEQKKFLTAALGLQETRAGESLDRWGYAKTVAKEAQRWGTPTHTANGREEKLRIARHEFEFPPERTLSHDNDFSNTEKIRAVIPRYTGWGDLGGQALTASGGLCAPLTPFYDMPTFGERGRPVRDALPNFRAERGGVNVPASTYIGDISTAISNITSANDALGGTFATKTTQALVCPAYTNVAVQILAHSRTYGNLNAMAWLEKIAHENDITMQALDRTAEGFLLDRIKALSINVTAGADTLGALIYLIDSVVKAQFGIRGRLRMGPDARFRALLPAVILDELLLDTISTPYDRFRSRDDIDAYLDAAGIDPIYYWDTPSTGTSQLPSGTQSAGALGGLPANIQWAIFPEGQFLHIDGGSLELGIVRDSTLNATNDFQLFGEQFENVAMLGPAQGAYWVTSNICPVGTFPPAGTARTCE